jgi:hypothetical protein
MSSIISAEAAATRLVSIFSVIFVSFGVKPSLIISNSVRLIAFLTIGRNRSKTLFVILVELKSLIRKRRKSSEGFFK